MYADTGTPFCTQRFPFAETQSLIFYQFLFTVRDDVAHRPLFLLFFCTTDTDGDARRGFPFGYQSGWWNGGVSPPYINNVSSPRLLLLGGAVRTDLYAEAPHHSGILCSYSAGVRCLATAAVLVTFDAKSDIRKDRAFGTFLAEKYTN